MQENTALPRVFVNFALDPMSSKAKIYVALVVVVHIVLIEGIIQAFVEMVKIEKNHRLTRFHTAFDAVDVPTDLKISVYQINKS